MRFDTFIADARIVDGTGSPWYRASVGVTDGKISYIGRNLLTGDARKEDIADAWIDAQDQYLMPGFVDGHTHSDFVLIQSPDAFFKLRQGVTTQAIGQCGYSAAPVRDKYIEALDSYVGFLKAGVKPDWSWRGFGEWLDYLDALPLGANVVSFVGHGTIRIAAMGFADRAASGDEVRDMRRMLEECMEQGACGMTSGLVYAPGVYASPEEMQAVIMGMRASQGLYESHMRNESHEVVESVRETIAVGEKTGVPVQVAHHKACGQKCWGLVQKTMGLVDEARSRGVDITVNQYPYDAGSTTLRVLLPGWVQEGGLQKLIERLQQPEIRSRLKEEILTKESGWDNYHSMSGGPDGVILLFFPETPQYEGKTLGEVSRLLGKDPLETAFDLIIANKGTDTSAYRMMSDEDIRFIMRHPAMFVASDSIPSPPGAKAHPRLYGAFPRVLDHFVRQEKVLSLEEAVRKMTSFPARRLGLHDRGLVAQGLAADLVLVDMDSVSDKADFINPLEPPVGMRFVMVNGVMAVKDGKDLGATAGRVLR